MKHFLMALGLLLSSDSFAFVPWTKLIDCDGPSGTAVLDDFSYSVHGMRAYTQQLVIRSRSVNEWLMQNSLLAHEITQNYPREVIIPLMRTSSDDHAEVAASYRITLGAFHYVVIPREGMLSLYVEHRATGRTAGEWHFRECRKVRAN